MLDCGFGIRETLKRLESLNTKAEQLDAILVTHEHQDHIGGVESLAAKFGTRVLMTEGTARGWKSRGRVTPEIIRADQTFLVGDIKIQPVPVPHDAREPVQFVFQSSDKKIGVLTDLGSLTPHIFNAYSGCQTILIEANHDLEMLQNGPYPFSLKRRVGGDWGHLNNKQTAEFVSRIESQGCLNQIIIGHISEKNNQIDLVQEALELHRIPSNKVIFVSQAESLDWLDIF